MDTIQENEMKKTNKNSRHKHLPSKAVSLCIKNSIKYTNFKKNVTTCFVNIDLSSNK